MIIFFLISHEVKEIKANETSVQETRSFPKFKRIWFNLLQKFHEYHKKYF